MLDDTTIWNDYQKGLSYQRKMQFDTDFAEFVRFKEGKQWPKVTEKTRHMPRPVFNILDMFIRSKRAAITNTTILMQFSPQSVHDDPVVEEMATMGAKDFTDFSNILWEDIGQDQLNLDMVDDMLTLGTGAVHYYWDNSIKSGRSDRIAGDLRGEIIDPLSIFFADPAEKDVQRQDWVILSTRLTLAAARALCEAHGVSGSEIEALSADKVKNPYNSEVLEDGVILLTKYFRKNGAVFYSKAFKNFTLVKETALTPKTGGAAVLPLEGIEGAEGLGVAAQAAQEYQIDRYPVVILSNRKRKNSIFGIGESPEVITINRIYNFMRAMEAFSVQKTGWPTLLVKQNAIQQAITNEPGETLSLSSNASREDIGYLNPPTMNVAASRLCDEIFSMVRTVSGTTEVSTGEQIGSNMAASAIIALQNQAKTPVEEQQKKFFRAIEEIGKIWCCFFKSYYSIGRGMVTEGENGEPVGRQFEGTQYAGVDFKLKVNVGSGSQFGEQLVMATLENLYNRKDIDKKQYVELLPDNVAPFKDKLLKLWKEQEAQMAQMQGMGGMGTEGMGGMGMGAEGGMA